MPTLDAIIAAAGDSGEALVVGGGEPTLRKDLPELVSQLGPDITLATDGLVLHRPDTVKALSERGLKRVRVGLHSSRADAHDWLVGIPGAHRRLRSAIQALKAEGVDVEIETVLTRPTAPYLEELVAFALKLGVRSLHFRPIRQVSPSDGRFAATAPRFSLMQPSLDAAVRIGLRQGASIRLTDIPYCAIPDFQELHSPPPQWRVPEGVVPAAQPERLESGCPGCTCAGAPSDYIALFGWTEFTSEGDGSTRAVLPVPHPVSGEDAVAPPARSTLSPATRVAEAVRLSAHANLGGDPMPSLVRPDVPAVVGLAWRANEPTRPIKQRMVQAAQVGATTLQILGDLDHPDAHMLVREALRLSFPQVVLTANLTGLASLEDKALFQLRDLHEVWTPECATSEAVAQRIQAVAKVPYRLEPREEKPTMVRPFEPKAMGSAGDYTGESWQQWASAK